VFVLLLKKFEEARQKTLPISVLIASTLICGITFGKSMVVLLPLEIKALPEGTPSCYQKCPYDYQKYGHRIR
jgi:hypothetical protein